jgi:hypothetical protein
MPENIFLARRAAMSATIFILISFLIAGCMDHDGSVNPPDNGKGSFQLVSKYDSIRSDADGGGIFIVHISPATDFTGDVNLSLTANPLLNANLSKVTLNAKDSVTDIIIRPSKSIKFGDEEGRKEFLIKVKAYNQTVEKTVNLKVYLYNWQEIENETPLEKLNQFKDYILKKYPAYSSIFGSYDNVYNTYPEVLVVEHRTFLAKDFEARLCYHVMIAPHDWSKLYIRPRNQINAVLALNRDTYGNITEIPVSGYPVMFGY